MGESYVAGRSPGWGGSLGHAAGPVAATRTPRGNPLPLWSSHEQSRTAHQGPGDHLGAGAFTTLLLSMRALPPRVLSSGPAPGHRQHQLFAGCAAVDGTGGQPNSV